MEKLKVAVLGATGMVGQRFLLLLANHPVFEVTHLAASPASAGKKYRDAIKKWNFTESILHKFENIQVLDATADMQKIASEVDFCFCAVNMKKDEIRALEEGYSKLE